MKKIKSLYKKIVFCIIILSTFAVNSCTKDYAEVNTNQNTIGTIGSSDVPFLFSAALGAIPFNDQVAQELFADQYAQYFANNATYFPSDRLVMVHDWVRNAFDPVYTRMLPQLRMIFDRNEKDSPEYALANIWWVFGFHRVTDYWGPIPYFNIGEPKTSIPYTAQDKIYEDFFLRLDSAITVLKANSTAQPFGSYDLVYKGNAAKWLKFANTLRLRLALRISNVDPAKARSEAEKAVADGVFTSSPADDALVPKNNFDPNQLSRMSNWNEFRMSASMESVLKGYDDPRMPEYFLPAQSTGTFEGIRNGLKESDLNEDINKPDNNSHVGGRWSDPRAFNGGWDSYLSTPIYVMSSAEAYFLRAEGALLGWNMGGNAKELYESGIRQSMYQWGITDDSKINSYINSTATPVAPGDYLNSPAMTNIPVLFHASDMQIRLEQIATQKWLALFPDGIEAWADFRRSHRLKLYPVAFSDNPDLTNPTTQWIRRITFLQSEKENNRAEVEKAVNLLGGPDKITTPLWWDKN